ncbi:MAG: DUF84 family protein [Myxococcota bacterium]
MAPALERVLGGAVARVGTENAAKLGAVRSALSSFAPDDAVLQVEGAGVSSGVSEQPIGWSEIATGARNRACAALALGDAALGFGIEDGLVQFSLETSESGSGARSGSPSESSSIFNVGCVWVTDGDREGHGFSSAFAYPSGCLEPAFAAQQPIGDLFDDLWSKNRDGESASRGDSETGGARMPDAAAPGTSPAEFVPSGRRGGNIGMLTQGRLDRSAYGAQAVICALMPFLHVDLYD